MYSIYVTNKIGLTTYVRLQSTGLPSSFIKEMEEMRITGPSKQEERDLFHTLLVQGGFHPILWGQTIAFSVQDMCTCMYASAASLFNFVSVVDFPVYPKMYGCIFINTSQHNPIDRPPLNLIPTNPKPVWISAKSGDFLPNDIIEAGNNPTEGAKLYFGRSHVSSFLPCKVTSKKGRCESWSDDDYETGDFLKNTGYELVRAKRGDPIPPHAVMTGVTEADGSLYVGRVGGNIPCSIITDQDNGTIKCFSYSGGKKAANGEILLLTNDPMFKT